MRMSDWSSDVFSSDLGTEVPDILDARADRITIRVMRGWAIMCGDYSEEAILLRLPVIGYRNPTTRDRLLLFTETELDRGSAEPWKIGRASRRERVGQYVMLPGVDGTLKKKTTH